MPQELPERPGYRIELQKVAVKDQCEKCGHYAGDVIFDETVNLLQCACTRCGFEWTTLTWADQPPEPVYVLDKPV